VKKKTSLLVFVWESVNVLRVSCRLLFKKKRTGNRPARKRNSREKRNYETAFSLGGKQKEALQSDE
jgi:hypothetical protein